MQMMETMGGEEGDAGAVVTNLQGTCEVGALGCGGWKHWGWRQGGSLSLCAQPLYGQGGYANAVHGQLPNTHLP